MLVFRKLKIRIYEKTKKEKIRIYMWKNSIMFFCDVGFRVSMALMQGPDTHCKCDETATEWSLEPRRTGHTNRYSLTKQNW